MRYDDEIILDELRICYVASNDDLSRLEMVEVGEFVEVNEYRLYRRTNDRFRCCFDVLLDGKSMAQLKYVHYTDRDEFTTFVYFKVDNHILYDAERLRRVLELPMKMRMVFNNSPQNSLTGTPVRL